MARFDVAVIGAGLLGCFAARALRRWDLSVALLEEREDVCTGVSRADTAIVYPGYDHRPVTGSGTGGGGIVRLSHCRCHI